jgi:ADP-ribose pyrophosphatase
MKIISKQIIYEGFYKLYKVTVDADGDKLERELFDTGPAVGVLLFDTVKQCYILIKQYRMPTDKPILEIVAGLYDHPDESLEETARREVEEETGYAVDQIYPITSYYSSPGAFAEKLHLFYAEVSHKKSAGGGLAEEHEQIETVEVKPEELPSLEIEDGKTLIAVQWAQLNKAKL